MAQRFMLLSLACAVALSAATAPAGQRDRRDERREIRQKIENYSRALRDKDAELNQATGLQKQAEADARGALEREKKAAMSLETANAEAVAARQVAADANRAAIEHDKRLRERVDAVPEVAEAKAHFDKVDRARETITESVLVPVRASDAYKANLKAIEELETERKNYIAATGVNSEPERLQLFIARQQTLELEIKQMEVTAIANSEQASAARKAAEDASAKLNKLRDQHLRELRDGPGSSQITESLADAKRIVGQKNKAIADAKRQLTAAKSDTRKARSKYAFYTDQVNKKQREVEGLENAIRELRRKLDNT